MGAIVVGVDGSESGQQALRFALKQARVDGATVRAVNAWHVPAPVYGGVGFSPGVDPRQVFEADARAILEKSLSEVASEVEGVAVEHVVTEGRAASVLVEESKNADLLVVGSRGHGGFSGLLLGSVSQECAAHADCPILIVHGKNRAG
jgi:nucleotide-binding universal stress UspA family protein